MCAREGSAGAQQLTRAPDGNAQFGWESQRAETQRSVSVNTDSTSHLHGVSHRKESFHGTRFPGIFKDEAFGDSNGNVFLPRALKLPR